MQDEMRWEELGPGNEAMLGTQVQCNLCKQSKGENAMGKTPLQKEITEKMSLQTGTRKLIMKELHH